MRTTGTDQQVVSNETELAEAEDENTVESSGAIKLKSSVEESRGKLKLTLSARMKMRSYSIHPSNPLF